MADENVALGPGIINILFRTNETGKWQLHWRQKIFRNFCNQNFRNETIIPQRKDEEENTRKCDHHHYNANYRYATKSLENRVIRQD